MDFQACKTADVKTNRLPVRGRNQKLWPSWDWNVSHLYFSGHILSQIFRNKQNPFIVHCTALKIYWKWEKTEEFFTCSYDHSLWSLTLCFWETFSLWSGERDWFYLLLSMWWAQMLKLFGFVTDSIEAWIISDQNQSSGEENLILNTDKGQCHGGIYIYTYI